MKQTEEINPMDVPQAYLKKYQRSGPRYTSYPTAPQFHTQFEIQDIETLWQDTNHLSDGEEDQKTGQKTGLSLYTHFPFCNTRCLYCGCFTHTGKSLEEIRQYVEALKQEAQRLFTIIAPNRPVYQMAFGGGSPTHLHPELLSDYIQHLENLVTFHQEAERSIEVDPRTVDLHYLQQLLDLGFNRFSFGVQDLDPQVQQNINRITPEEKLIVLMDYLHQHQMRAINLDLIYGLPGQTPQSFSNTVKKIIALQPSRIALFGYAHVPWVSPHQERMAQYHIPNTEERMILFGKAFDLLLKAGYRHIGMDHFALPGDELLIALENHTLTRNFMGYTTKRGLDLIGIGASSISSVGNTYTQNQKDLRQYMDNNTHLHWHKALTLSPEDLLRRAIILDLFCNFYLHFDRIEQNHHISFHSHFATELEQLKPMSDDDLLHIGDREIIVTPLGRFFIRNICMVFDQYLAKDKQNSEKRYSKTL